jgi:hypothetical protein
MHLQTSVSPNSFLSYSYKFQGVYFFFPQGLRPFFRPSRATSLTQDLPQTISLHALTSQLADAPGGGGGTANSFPSRASRAMNLGCPLPDLPGLGSQIAGPGALTKSSPRCSADSASLRYPFPRFPSQLSDLSTFKHHNAAFPPLTTHYSLLRILPRTSTLPPLNYGIIPPHRGVSRSSLTTGRNPFRKRGGFSV